MGVLRLDITTGKTAETLTRDYQRTTSAKYATVQSLADLLDSVVSGNQQYPSVVSTILGTGHAAYAAGTFTLTSVIATDAISINGVTFTCVASGATGNQFNVGASDTLTAVNLAAAINASVTALVSGYVVATSALTVVTVTSAFPGLAGNQTLIASADGTIVATGARLTGGTADSSAKTYTF